MQSVVDVLSERGITVESIKMQVTHPQCSDLGSNISSLVQEVSLLTVKDFLLSFSECKLCFSPTIFS